jgi:hypothetical protein
VKRALAGIAVTALALAAIGAASGRTFSAFSGSTSNAANTFAAAASFGGCTASTVTAPANIDSWIDQSSSGSNFGSDQILKVKREGGKAMRALVRFNLPPVPQGCSVTGATLRLYQASGPSNRTLEARRLSASWAENTVRWTNQPTPTGTAATTSTGSGWRQWNVTSHVQAMYSGSNHGWLIKFDAEGNPVAEVQLHARNKGSQHPELQISFG